MHLAESMHAKCSVCMSLRLLLSLGKPFSHGILKPLSSMGRKRRSEGKHSIFSPYSEETQTLHVFKDMWLHIYSFLLIFVIFIMYVCMYVYMHDIYTYTHYAYMCIMFMPTESEAIDSTRASSCELWAWVLRLKLRALARAVSTRNHGAISSAPRYPYGIYENPSNRDQCRLAH